MPTLEINIADPLHFNVLEDLIAYTSLPRDEVLRRLSRPWGVSTDSQFERYLTERATQPMSLRSDADLLNFYRNSSSFLWENAVHPFRPVLHNVRGAVLDYGSGVGTNALGMSQKCERVDCVEVGSDQACFCVFRAMRHQRPNMHQIMPWYMGVFDPIHCVQSTYDSIVLLDVLEHIRSYHVTLRHLVSKLNKGGHMFVHAPFSDNLANYDQSIHLYPSMPLEEAMGYDMERIDQYVWRKT